MIFKGRICYQHLAITGGVVWWLVLGHFAGATVSLVVQAFQLFATPGTVARQAPLSMGILQARILEWVAMPSSKGSSRPRDWTQVSCIVGSFFTIWATREALGGPSRMQWYADVIWLKQIGVLSWNKGQLLYRVILGLQWTLHKQEINI